MLDDFDLARAGNAAVGKAAALVFVGADSGEEYITVDGNEGDRCVRWFWRWWLLLTCGGSRKNLTAWHGGDALVLAVAAQNNNTVVVAHSVGPLILEPWIDHPNVTAVRPPSPSRPRAGPTDRLPSSPLQVLWAGLPGTEAGHALADVLYGAWNPSGRLPYTIARAPGDYPAPLVLGGTPQDILSIPYTEGCAPPSLPPRIMIMLVLTAAQAADRLPAL